MTPRPHRAARPQPRLLPLLLALLMLPVQPVLAQDAAKPAAARRGGLSGGTPVTVNFVNADLEAVTRAMAAMLDRQILVDPRVKGVITLYSEQPILVRDAWLQYLAALRGLGFTVVETAGLLKVLPEPDAKLQAGTVSVGTVGARGDQVITQIFRLSHENPNNLVAVLRPLISPNNTINANPGNSSLVITDYADNLARIGKIIAALDQPAATDVEVIPLKHAIATDMVALVQKLGDGGPAAGVPGLPVAGASMSVLADARSNSLIIRAANPSRLASVRSLIDRLDRPGVGGPAGQINVVYLKNADATKLASVLRAAFGGGGGGGGSSTGGGFGNQATPGAIGQSGNQGGGANPVATAPLAQSAQPSTGGFIQADPATNSLVISAAEPLYRQIRSVIDQLDGRRAQVFVESMIVEMDANKAAELGFQWQGLLGNNGNRFGLAAGTNFGSGANNILNLSVAAAGGSTTTLPGTGLNLALLQRINGIYTLGALARFLETVSGTNILSTPNLVALDNEEAKIVVGANVPFVTGSFTNTGGGGGASVNPFQTVERKDVGLTLKIKPQIGEGGVIRMSVFQENSSVVGGTLTNANGPTTNKNSLETTVVADDGQIMVLGGQMKEEYTDGENKVPMLGDVPMVGNLFKNSSRERRKSILLVFLRPVVLRDAQAANGLALDRYEVIRAQQQQGQPTPKPLMPITDSPVLPEPPAPGQGGFPLLAPSTLTAPAPRN